MMCLKCKCTVKSKKILKDSKQTQKLNMNLLQYAFAQKLGLLEDNLPEEILSIFEDSEPESQSIKTEHALSFREHVTLYYNMLNEYAKLNGQCFYLDVDGTCIKVTMRCLEIKFLKQCSDSSSQESALSRIGLSMPIEFILDAVVGEGSERTCVDLNIHRLGTALLDELYSLTAFCRIDSTLFEFSPVQICVALDNTEAGTSTDSTESNDVEDEEV